MVFHVAGCIDHYHIPCKQHKIVNSIHIGNITMHAISKQLYVIYVLFSVYSKKKSFEWNFYTSL